MKRTTKFLISLAIFLMLIMPVVSLAAGGLVPCTNTPVSGVVPDKDKCDFSAFLMLINGLIHFALFDLAIPISAIMFCYAGSLLITSGGSTENRGKAKDVFTNTVKGLVIASAAWIIIHTFLSILNFKGSWIHI